VGCISALGGVVTKTVDGDKGILNVDNIKREIRQEDIHEVKTALICLENSHNRAGGTVTPPKTIEEIYQLAHKHNIFVHLDGARLFNAAVALNTEPALLVKNVDSVMFCLSKGLSAPVGSILSASKEFIQKARKYRKMLGGGMRQAGILAAAGIISLEKMVKRLEEDHKNARILAEGLNEIEGIKVDLETVQTNMVYFDVDKLVKELNINTDHFLERLLDEYGIRGGVETPIQDPTEIRFVTHYGISEEDIYTTINAIKMISKRIN
jgi:threonine aldolase